MCPKIRYDGYCVNFLELNTAGASGLSRPLSLRRDVTGEKKRAYNPGECVRHGAIGAPCHTGNINKYSTPADTFELAEAPNMDAV